MTGIALPIAIALAVVVLSFGIGRTGAMRRARQVNLEGGLKQVLKVYGWKAVMTVVAFYLVRDFTLYIVMPWLAARGLLSWR